MKTRQPIYLESTDRGRHNKMPLQRGFTPKEYMQLEKQREDSFLKRMGILIILVVVLLCLSPFIPQWVTITGSLGSIITSIITYLKRRPT